MERVKNKLRTLNPINQKSKGMERGTPSKSVNQKKPAPAPPKTCSAGLVEPCGKCERTNHTALESRVGTNKCIWCGSPEHLITSCSQRLKVVDKDVAKPLAPPRQGPPTSKACSSRKGVCNEQEGSRHLWYGS